MSTRLRRRSWSIVGLASVLALAVVAAATAGNSTSSAASGTVTLSGWASSPKRPRSCEQVLRGFQKTYPQIKVDYAPSAATTGRDAREVRGAQHRPTSSTSTRTCSRTGSSRACSSRSTRTSRGASSTTKPFFPRLERLQGARREDLRLPEGLVAARDGDNNAHAREGGRQGADDVGAAPAAADEAKSSCRRAAGRSACRRAGTGCSRSSTRTAAAS